MSDIKQELIEATQINQEDGEENETYLHRLLQAVAELNDDQWDKLSDETQAWFNEAVEAHNNEVPVPGFPDESPPEAAPPEQKRTISSTTVQGSSRITKIRDHHVISLSTRRNPKRKGSRSYDEFELYEDGMSVGEYIKKGGSRASVRWDYNKGFVDLK